MNDELMYKSKKSKQLMSKLIQNTVIGLNEIQIMNYSEYQLNKLDTLMEEYFQSRFSTESLFIDLIDDLRNHSILRWLFETLLEIRIRTKRLQDPDLEPITHKEYNKMKSQCNSLYNSLTKLYGGINGIRRNINRQLYLKKVLYLPGFIDEEKDLKKLRGFDEMIQFEYIEFKYIYFRYKQNYGNVDDKNKEKKDDDKNTEKEMEITKEFIDQQVEIVKRKKKDYLDDKKKKEVPPATSATSGSSSNSSASGGSDIEEKSEKPEPKKSKKAKKKSSKKNNQKQEKMNTIPKTNETWNKFEFKLLINDTIRFDRGKTYGICGRNESGKTTLIDILCKLRSPQYIDCVINGKYSFNMIPRVELRKQISYISQKPFLFEGTVGENIHIANPNATVEEVREAAKLGGVFLSVQSDSSASLSYNEISRIMINGKAGNYNNGRGRGRGGRGGGGGRGGRGRGRKRKGGKRTIATHMVEGIKNWGKNDDEENDGGKGKKGGGMLDYVMSFFRKVDDKQVNLKGDAGRKPSASPNSSMTDLYALQIKERDGKKKKGDDKDEKNGLQKTDYKHQILNYEIKGNGNNVSGGLKQSIALSRVFLRKQCKIVICDESFNSMDMVKKNTYIYPALFDFIKKYNMTLIMISHDILECFTELDHIIVLEQGTLHNQGSHKYLFENSVLYRKLCGQR